MKKIGKILVGLLMTFSMASLVSCKKKADFTVGVCQLVQHPALDQATQGFIDALEARMDAAGKSIEIDRQIASGESDICTTIVNKFVSNKYDLIMANATPALQAAVNATLEIPILGTSITDYGVALGKTISGGVIGENISGTSDLAPLEDQAGMFEELLPRAKKIGICYCSSEANSLFQVNQVKSYLEGAGKTVTVASFSDSNDLQSVITSLSNQVDAIYLPTDNTVANNASIIDAVCQLKNIPVIAGEENLCKACGIATLSISYYEIGLKTGEMAADILLEGADISTMAIQYDTNYVKKYNETLCNKYSVVVPDTYTKLGD